MYNINVNKSYITMYKFELPWIENHVRIELHTNLRYEDYICDECLQNPRLCVSVGSNSQNTSLSCKEKLFPIFSLLLDFQPLLLNLSIFHGKFLYLIST